jgi:hypothetical protein
LRPHFRSPLRSPNVKGGALFLESSCTYLSVADEGAPLPGFFDGASMERDSLFQSLGFISLRVSSERALQMKYKASHETWRNSRLSRSPKGTEVVHTIGCGLVPQGDPLDTPIDYPTAM